MAVEAHVALVPLFFVLAWVFATSLLPAQEGLAAYTSLGFWALGLAGALLLFASVLAHEVAHAVAARRVGLPVDRITVLFHSGPGPIERAAPGPWQELLVSAAGPVATFGLAALAFVASRWLGDVRFVGPLTRLLTVANVLLGLSYLLPGFPLDGGRILRAVLWGLAGSLLEGTRWACWIGRAFALALGILSAVLVATVGLGSLALWGLLLAVALWIQAGTAWRAMRFQECLKGLSARDLLQPAPQPVSRVMSVAEALVGALHQASPTRPRTWLVEWNGRLGGLVTQSALRRVPEAERGATPVGQVARRLRWEHLLSPATSLDAALRRMVAERLPLLPVVEGERLVGVVTREAIVGVVEGGAALRAG